MNSTICGDPLSKEYKEISLVSNGQIFNITSASLSNNTISEVSWVIITKIGFNDWSSVEIKVEGCIERVKNLSFSLWLLK